MPRNLNRALLIGRVGTDLDVFQPESGLRVVRFRLRTTDTWRDRVTQEPRERSQWHQVVIVQPGLADFAIRAVHKNSQVFVEGTIEHRTFVEDGVERHITEIVLGNVHSSIEVLGGPMSDKETAAK